MRVACARRGRARAPLARSHHARRCPAPAGVDPSLAARAVTGWLRGDRARGLRRDECAGARLERGMAPYRERMCADRATRLVPGGARPRPLEPRAVARP